MGNAYTVKSRAAVTTQASGSVAPAVVLPEQLFAGSRMQTPPEQRLMIAILEDAIYCFERFYGARDTSSRRQFRDAQDWLMNEPHCRPFSFEHVCFILGLDAAAVREVLLRRQARRHPPVEPPPDLSAPDKQ